MRLCVFPIFRIPSGELLINDGDDFAILDDEIALAKVPVRETGSVATSMTPRDAWTVDPRTILLWDVSTEECMEFLVIAERTEEFVSYPVVEALSKSWGGDNSFPWRFECSKLANVIGNLFHNSLLLTGR